MSEKETVPHSEKVPRPEGLFTDPILHQMGRGAVFYGFDWAGTVKIKGRVGWFRANHGSRDFGQVWKDYLNDPNNKDKIKGYWDGSSYYFTPEEASHAAHAYMGSVLHGETRPNRGTWENRFVDVCKTTYEQLAERYPNIYNPRKARETETRELTNNQLERMRGREDPEVAAVLPSPIQPSFDTMIPKAQDDDEDDDDPFETEEEDDWENEEPEEEQIEDEDDLLNRIAPVAVHEETTAAAVALEEEICDYVQEEYYDDSTSTLKITIYEGQVISERVSEDKIVVRDGNNDRHYYKVILTDPATNEEAPWFLERGLHEINGQKVLVNVR